jgi:hypothetical protein
MLISNRRQCAQNRGFHPGNAGVGLDHMSAADKLALAMIPEIEIWRAASLMLKRYGEEGARGKRRSS